MQVSVGTLLAFTMVAISVLILRYVPPDEVPLPSSLQEAIDSVSLRYGINNSPGDVSADSTKDSDIQTPLLVNEESSSGYPVVEKAAGQTDGKFIILSGARVFISLEHLENICFIDE